VELAGLELAAHLAALAAHLDTFPHASLLANPASERRLRRPTQTQPQTRVLLPSAG
jgi:hypothetical protein